MTYSQFVDLLMESDTVFAATNCGFGVIEVTRQHAMEYIIDSFSGVELPKGNPTAMVDEMNGKSFMIIACDMDTGRTREILPPSSSDKYPLPKREDALGFVS